MPGINRPLRNNKPAEKENQDELNRYGLVHDDAYEHNRIVGLEIKALRKQAGMIQKELGMILGIGESGVSGIENGRIALPPKRYKAFAEAFGLNEERFADFLLRHTNPRLYELRFPNAGPAHASPGSLTNISHFRAEKTRATPPRSK